MTDLQEIRWRYHWRVRHAFWRWLGLLARRVAYWCHTRAIYAERDALKCEPTEAKAQRIAEIRARYAKEELNG